MRLYCELGLNVQASAQEEEAGIYQLIQQLASNKLKIFASLSRFLVEYRIGDEKSPLLQCCQSLRACSFQEVSGCWFYEVACPPSTLPAFTFVLVFAALPRHHRCYWPGSSMNLPALTFVSVFMGLVLTLLKYLSPPV